MIFIASGVILHALLVFVSANAYIFFVQKQFLGVQLAESLQRSSEREKDTKAKDTQVLSLSSENAGLQQELRIRTRDGEDLTNRITELQADLRKNIREVERMRSKVREGSALSLRAQAERVTEVSELRTMLEAMKAGSAQRDQEIQTKAAEALASAAENEDLRRQILSFKGASAEFEARIAGMSDDSRKREGALEAARVRNKEMHESNISHSSNLARQTKEMAKLREDLQELRDGCSLKDLQLRAKDDRAGDLSTANEKLKKQVLDLRQGSEALASHMAVMEVEVRMRMAELETARYRDKERKERNLSLLVSLATRDAEISQLKTRLETVEIQSSSKDDQIQDLKRTGDRLEHEVLTLKEKFKECIQRLTNLKNAGVADIDVPKTPKSMDRPDPSCIDEDAADRFRFYFSEPEPGISHHPSFQGTRAPALVKGNNHNIVPERRDRS